MPYGGRRRARAAEEGPERGPRSRARAVRALTLVFAVVWLSALVRLGPLLRFTVWGSDQGEYAALLGGYLTTGGTTAVNYQGWGVAYPDFPGMYAFAGTFAAISGLDPFVVLSLVVPVTASLTALVAFALTLRLTGSLTTSAVAGLIVGVAMPEAFAGSHAMPGALGGLLAFAAVASVAFAAKSPSARWAVAAISLALVPTHHLSAFIAGAALLVVALVEARMGPDDRAKGRIIDAALGGAAILIIGSAFYWVYGASNFRTGILDHVSPTVALVLPSATIFGVVGAVALAYWMESKGPHPRRSSYMFDDRTTFLRLGAGLGVAVLVALLAATVGVPGTSAVIQMEDALIFLPLAATLAISGAGPGRLRPVRGGLVPTCAVVAVLASLVVGFVFLPTVLIPYRHLQYFVDFASPLAAIAVTFAAGSAAIFLFPEKPGARAWVSSMIVAALLLSVCASIYPTKTALAGYEEGTQLDEAAAVTWMAWFMPPNSIVVTDHRLSSLSFGFANQRPTWDDGGPVLHGDATQARAAIDTVTDPRGHTGVTAVLITDDIIGGAALSQYAPARPIEGPALEKFSGPGFVKLFDNGDAVAYWALR